MLTKYISPAYRGAAFRLPLLRFASLILAFFLLAVAGVIAFFTIQRMENNRALVLHTYQVRGLLKDLRADIGETHAQFDLYEISGDWKEISDFDRRLQLQLLIVAQLQLLTADNRTQQERLTRLKVVLDHDIAQLQDCMLQQNCLLPSSGDKKSFMDQISGRRRELSQMLHELEDAEGSLLAGRLNTGERLFTLMIGTLFACLVLAFILLLYNFNLLFREIQQRKEQEHTQKVSAESFRMLSARILELQDVERRKIARELHDSVGQFLAGLKLNLGRLQRRELDANSENHALLMETIDLTDRAIGEVRTISHLLHPPLLDELGFHSAARWYTEGFAKRSGVQAQLRLPEIADRLPKEIELALFRVLQESLTNVHRHAGASKVTIDLDCTDDEVTLFVRDDGKGLKREFLQRFQAGQGGGIGLAGMRERLVDLGGTLEVKSTASGTQIRATLPTNGCKPNSAATSDVAISPN